MMDGALLQIIRRLDALERAAERRAPSQSPGLTFTRLAVVNPAAVSAVDFQNISQAYSGLLFAVSTRNTTTTNTNILVQLSADGTTIDTGANYDFQYNYGNAAVAGAAEQFAATSLFIGNHSNVANMLATSWVVFLNYSNTTTHKPMVSTFGHKFGTASGQMVSGTCFGSWRNTSAIKGVRFSSLAGNFDAGSTIRLYGLP